MANGESRTLAPTLTFLPLLGLGVIERAAAGPARSTNTDDSVQAAWTFASAAGSTQTLDWQVRAAQPGSYVVPFKVYRVPTGGGAPQLRQSGSIVVTVSDAVILLQQAQAR